MKKRPLSITIISWLFIAVGGMGLVASLLPLAQRMAELERNPLEWGAVVIVRLLGLVAGVFMLRGCNWARWLLVAWLAFHVVLSAFHSVQELTIHALLMAVIVWLLFRAPARAYFHG